MRCSMLRLGQSCIDCPKQDTATKAWARLLRCHMDARPHIRAKTGNTEDRSSRPEEQSTIGVMSYRSGVHTDRSRLGDFSMFL